MQDVQPALFKCIHSLCFSIRTLALCFQISKRSLISKTHRGLTVFLMGFSLSCFKSCVLIETQIVWYSVNYFKIFHSTAATLHYSQNVCTAWVGPRHGHDHSLLCHQQTSSAIAVVFFLYPTQLTHCLPSCCIHVSSFTTVCPLPHEIYIHPLTKMHKPKQENHF